MDFFLGWLLGSGAGDELIEGAENFVIVAWIWSGIQGVGHLFAGATVLQIQIGVFFADVPEELHAFTALGGIIIASLVLKLISSMVQIK